MVRVLPGRKTFRLSLDSDTRLYALGWNECKTLRLRWI